MADKPRIFFAQPVDYIDNDAVVESVNNVRKLLCNLPVEIVAPYCYEDWYALPVDRDLAKSIVKKDIETIDSCDIILVDISREDRQAIGIIFEMAYSWFRGNKKIIVYVGESTIANRVWISAVAHRICYSWEDVLVAIEGYLKA